MYRVYRNDGLIAGVFETYYEALDFARYCGGRVEKISRKTRR